MAGSGIRGQFEEKFKALLRDIEDEVNLNISMLNEILILAYRVEKSFASLTKFVSQRRSSKIGKVLTSFTDTLFNLGKAEGSIDAGQMIKPALARGLQLVGATTRKFC